MGLLGRTWNRITGHAPRRNPEEDPYTFTFRADNTGLTEKKTVPVGSYNIQVTMKDGRIGSILGLTKNSEKIGDNHYVAEGDNPIQEVHIALPEFTVIKQPNGRLNVDQCKTTLNGGVEQKFRVNIILPDDFSAPWFKSWWSLFGIGKRVPKKYSDYNVTLVPLDEQGVVQSSDNTISIQPGYIPSGFPGQGAPRLRLLNRKGASVGFSRDIIDRYEIRTIIDEEAKHQGWFEHFRHHKAYILSAVFTNEEFRDLHPGMYSIRAKFSYGKNIPHNTEVGRVEFIQGSEATMGISFERVNPSGEQITEDEAVQPGSRVHYRVLASYTNPNSFLPNGLPVFLQLPTGVTAKKMSDDSVINSTNSLLVNMGKTDIFYIENSGKPETITMQASMTHAKPIDTKIVFGGYKIKLMELITNGDNQDAQRSTQAGTKQAVTAKFQVLDNVKEDPVLPPGPKNKLMVKVDKGAMIRDDAGNLVPEAELKIGDDGIVQVHVTSPHDAMTAELTASLDRMFPCDPVSVPLTFKPVKIKIIIPDIPQEHDEEKKIMADGYAVTPVTVQASWDDGNNFQAGVKINLSLTGNAAGAGTSTNDDHSKVVFVTDDTGSTVVGDGQYIYVYTDEHGKATAFLRSGTTDGKFTLEASGFNKSDKLNLKTVHPTVKIFNAAEEQAKDPLSAHSDGGRTPDPASPKRGFTLNADNKKYFGYRDDQIYALAAEAYVGTNKVRDGTLIRFFVDREYAIGEFDAVTDYPFVREHGNNDKMVEVKDGVARVNYKVTSSDPEHRFMTLYASVAYSTNKDSILIPVITSGQGPGPDPDDPEPSYQFPNLQWEINSE